MQLVILSELYYPELDATGYFVTGIAEGLAATQDATIRVLCAQPTYHNRTTLAPWREERRGVRIRRLWSARCNPRKILGRLINFSTVSFSMFAAALMVIRRGDHVLVVTNPPLLPFLSRLACAMRGARMILLVHDVYPEVLAVVGALRSDGWFWRLLEATNRRLYQSCTKVVVLGRDMQAIVDRKIGRSGLSVIIPNWADVDVIRPEERRNELLFEHLRGCEWPESKRREKLLNRVQANPLVVLYCGNHGRTHDFDTLLRVAMQMAADPSVLFLFVGEGSGKPRAMALAEELGLPNTAFSHRVAEQELSATLALGDLCAIALKPRMSGVSVPSRMYNLMAAGRPILAITEPDSELGVVVAEERIGWICSSGDVEGVTDVIRFAKANRETLAMMGKRARAAACVRYSRVAGIWKWASLVDDLR